MGEECGVGCGEGKCETAGIKSRITRARKRNFGGGGMGRSKKPIRGLLSYGVLNAWKISANWILGHGMNG